MKCFIERLAFFTAIVLVLGCMADYRISSYLKSCGHETYSSWNDFHSNKLSNDVLINGNSRALVQYNPYVIDSVLGVDSYNMGFDGSGINRQILKYRTYCKLQGHRPAFLIQNIDFVTMTVTNGINRELFFPYFIFDRQMIRDFDRYEYFSVFEKYMPCFRYVGYPALVQSAIGLNSMYIQTPYKGFIYNDSPYDGTSLSELDSIDYCQDVRAIELFDDFLSEEISSGVKILFVYAPIFIGATQKMSNIRGMYEMYDSVARKYEIPILDYTYNSISSDSSFFYNAMHLNRAGAELFSKMLANDIDSLRILDNCTYKCKGSDNKDGSK